MQLELAFVQIPSSRVNLWAALDEAERLEVLARVLAQAAAPDPDSEEHDDE